MKGHVGTWETQTDSNCTVCDDGGNDGWKMQGVVEDRQVGALPRPPETDVGA